MNIGYKLNNIPIEYIGINIQDHYAESGVFIATKVLEMIMIEYSQTGIVTYSNEHFIGTFGISRRGLQNAFTLLEKVGIIKRTFADPDTRYTRTGFILDVTMAIEWLSKTRDDVKDLQRGTLLKHFVMQAVIKVKMFARDLKKAIKHKKNELDREAAAERIEAINEQNRLYELHCQAINKKREKRLKRDQELFSQEEMIQALKDMVKGLGYTPPETSKN
jgi:hypothetical protein